MNENHVCEFHENIHIINTLTKLFSNEILYGNIIVNQPSGCLV